MTAAGFSVSYSEAPGAHEWDFWDRSIKGAIEWWTDLRGQAK